MNKYIFILFGLITTSLITSCSYYKSAYRDYVIPPKHISFNADKNEIELPYPCPDWRDNPIINSDNSQMNNLGCATLNNKAQMVSNTQDLLKGRGNHQAETESSVRTIERYYNGELTPTIASNESTTTSDNN